MPKSPLKSVDNNSAYSIVNAAYKQSVGDASVATETLDDFTDAGVAFNSLTMHQDQFVKALIDQVVNFYVDTAFEEDYSDPYYVESRRFANVLQVLNAQAPDVQESHAWKDFTPTTSQGVTTYKTVGTYKIKPPTVQSKYFQKTVSWELPIAITNEQLVDAFKSSEELRGFVDYLFVVVDNKISEHKRSLSAANRNSFMANKLLYAASQGAKGIHKVNLLTEYNTQRGGTLTSVADFFEDPAAGRFGAAQILLFKKYMEAQSILFNTEGLVKFTPRDRMVLEVNSAFESALVETAYSTTYHDEMLALPNYRSVPAWQGFGINHASTGAGDPATYAAAFDQTSKIDVSVDAGDVSQSGIVALLADKFAIMHTIRQERVASQYFDMEQLTLYAYQHRSAYINNLAQNAVIFTIEAPSN